MKGVWFSGGVHVGNGYGVNGDNDPTISWRRSLPRTSRFAKRGANSCVDGRRRNTTRATTTTRMMPNGCAASKPRLRHDLESGSTATTKARHDGEQNCRHQKVHAATRCICCYYSNCCCRRRRRRPLTESRTDLGGGKEGSVVVSGGASMQLDEDVESTGFIRITAR